MSSTGSIQIQSLRKADGVGIPSERLVLACPDCGGHAWRAETNQVLRCESCRTGLPVRGNIIDCLQRGDPLDSPELGWDAFYREKTYSAEEDWWYLSCWRRHLFGRHFRDLSEKVVVDFGCGRADRVAALAPITTHGYHYVGIDASLEALSCAAQAIPNGLFVHGSLDSLRLRAESADFVLCLGVLMYAEDFSESLGRLLQVLKPGGILLLHEQIRRKSWHQFIQKFIRLGRETYPPARGVGLHKLGNQLAQRGSILHQHLGGSPLRKPFKKLLDRTFLEPLRPLASWLDSVWCVTGGRVLPAIGASEVQIVFQKTSGTKSSGKKGLS